MLCGSERLIGSGVARGQDTKRRRSAKELGSGAEMEATVSSDHRRRLNAATRWDEIALPDHAYTGHAGVMAAFAR